MQPSSTMPPGEERDDLDGSAPDESVLVLLIIDAINDFDFEGARELLPHARRMAAPLRRLKARARRAGICTVYVNDNFGRWRSDFRMLVARCLRRDAPGRAIARALRPAREDYFVLKPKHSGFYSTTLDLLLRHLGARTLILTGLTGDMCVLFTAQDAFMRGYRLIVPSDCVASRSPRENVRALRLMRRVLEADTRPAGRVDLEALVGAREPSGIGRARGARGG
jgi:nicotinamidase-related amidase